MTDLHFRSASALASELRQGRIGARELLEHFLARVDRFNPTLNAIIQHLNRNLVQKSNLTQLAQQFNISPNYICSLFSKHLGTTYSAYLTKIRMEQAARLLAGTDAPVKEIALKSGYEDYFYFCRVFREYHGATPTQFRNRK